MREWQHAVIDRTSAKFFCPALLKAGGLVSTALMVTLSTPVLTSCQELPPARTETSKQEKQESPMDVLAFGDKPFTITPEHRKALRKMIVGWTSCESGAPGVDFAHTFGVDPDKDEEDFSPAFAKLLEVKPAGPSGRLTPEQQEQMNTFVQELATAFRLLIHDGKLAPGKYSFENHLPELYPEGYFVTDANGREHHPIPTEKNIDFDLTDEHLKLLRHANVSWFGLDPKRPYGDMTYYEIDMADALGIPFSRDGKGHPNFTPTQLEHFRKLHIDMLYALQLVLLKGEIECHRFP